MLRSMGSRHEMHKSSSLASISTRATSVGSLLNGLGKEHDVEILRDSQADAIASLPPAKHRRAALSALAGLVLMWAWSRYMKRILKRTEIWGSARIALLGAAGIASFGRMLGAIGWSQLDADPACVTQQQKMVVFHPHGCYVFGGISNLAKQPRNMTLALGGTFIGVADAPFQVPFIRELLLMLNCRPANAQMIDALLGQGKSVAICPGGIHEQMATEPTCERCFFPPNLGFVRQALKHGTPLLPIYTFGENQLYDVPAWSRSLSKTVQKYTGAGLPLALGRWGLPLIPKKTQFQTYVGRLVDVGPANATPSDARVRQMFLAYCAELQRLFNEHKDSALPADVAAKGLTLIWRGHETEDLFTAGLAKHWNTTLQHVQSAPAISISRL